MNNGRRERVKEDVRKWIFRIRHLMAGVEEERAGEGRDMYREDEKKLMCKA
jgi:hypothetical protein